MVVPIRATHRLCLRDQQLVQALQFPLIVQGEVHRIGEEIDLGRTVEQQMHRLDRPPLQPEGQRRGRNLPLGGHHHQDRTSQKQKTGGRLYGIRLQCTQGTPPIVHVAQHPQQLVNRIGER